MPACRAMMEHPISNLRRGITLLEILICIGIVLVIAGIVIPVLGSARLSAIHSAEVSNLCQIYLASTIYSEGSATQNEDVRPLVELGLLPLTVLSSNSDPYPDGFSKKLSERLVVSNLFTPPSFRFSHITSVNTYNESLEGIRRQYQNKPIVIAAMESDPTAGWLVSAMPLRYSSLPRDTPATNYVDEFAHLRLTRIALDGSAHRIHSIYDAKNRGCTPLSLFFHCVGECLQGLL